MNRIKYIYQVIDLLIGSHVPMNLKDIKRHLDNTNEEDIPLRRVKQYLSDIQENFNVLENVQGRYGGYNIDQRAKRSLMKTVARGLNDIQKNALNDAFEIAVRSPSYHYTSELYKAKGIFYSQKSLKDEDYEYYIGKENIRSKNKELYIIKNAMVEGKKIYITSKYEYYDLLPERYLFSPLFVIHDTDETIIVLKDQSGQVHYQNFNNIISIESSEQTFTRETKDEMDYSQHVKGTTTKAKNTSKVILKVHNIKGWRFYDLYEHECDEINRTKNTLELKFFEDYKAIQFLLVMKEYAKIEYISEKLKKYLNKKIKAF